MHAPLIGIALSIAGGLLLLGISLRAAVRAKGIACVFAGFVLLGLILSPVSSESHYTMALLPIALLTSELRARGVPHQGAALLASGTLLIAAPFPFRSARLTDGLLALLAYPRLYGALLLWALALAWSTTSRQATEAFHGARPDEPAQVSRR
jgi:hypothetical protein